MLEGDVPCPDRPRFRVTQQSLKRSAAASRKNTHSCVVPRVYLFTFFCATLLWWRPLNLRMLLTIALAMSLYVTVVSSSSQANALGPANGVSFTFTKTASLTATSAGPIKIWFDSVDLFQFPPQAYSFNVMAKTSPGAEITKLSWHFGDGSSKDVPYCCESQVSEVQYHAYSQPGMYTVKVVAVDNTGNSGYAQVVVNWVIPVPEYDNYGIILLMSMLLAPILLRRSRTAAFRA